jgi:glycine dehydrogenase subunit 1
MLKAIGVTSQDGLFDSIPVELRKETSNAIPKGISESEVIERFRQFSNRNVPTSETAFFLGGGMYRHFVPSLVDALISRSEFLTPYTPYQAEASQGTLQSMFEFQTLVAAVAQMDFSNASMYDGATSMKEAAFVANRITKKPKIMIHKSVHPHWIQTIETAVRHYPVVTCERFTEMKDWKDVCCVLYSNPSVDGSIADLTNISKEARKNKAMMVIGTSEIVSLGLLKSPGEMDADMFVGDGNSLGSGMSFGGPQLGLFAGKNSVMRQAPGRLIGQATDPEGNIGYCLTLAAREQHIKREKATSNICTAGALLATAFSIHLSLLGKEGFRKLARINHHNAILLADEIAKIDGVKITTPTFFNEFTVQLPKDTELMVEELADQKILAGVPLTRLYKGFDDVDPKKMLMAATELTTQEDIDRVTKAIRKYLA